MWNIVEHRPPAGSPAPASPCGADGRYTATVVEDNPPSLVSVSVVVVGCLGATEPPPTTGAGGGSIWCLDYFQVDAQYTVSGNWSK